MKLILETNHYSNFDNKAYNRKVFLVWNSPTPEGRILIHENNKPVATHKNEDILSKIFGDAIDLDEWKYSWHLDTYKFMKLPVRDKIKAILIEKQKKRENELKYLREVEQILMACPIKEIDPIDSYKTTYESTGNAIDELPF